MESCFSDGFNVANAILNSGIANRNSGKLDCWTFPVKQIFFGLQEFSKIPDSARGPYFVSNKRIKER